MVNDNMNTKRIKHLSLMIILVLLIFVSSMLIFSHLLKEVNNYFVHLESYFEEDVTENVLTIKEHIEQEISIELMDIAVSIEDDILNNTDLNKLEKQLNSSKDIPDKLENIFRKNIYDVYLLGIENERNNIFICNKNGIISDYDISNATDKKNTRTWEHEIKKQHNTRLAKNTIDKLLIMDNYNNLVFERKNDKDTTLYGEISNDTIKKIIKEDGIYGLEPYTFLIPIYITNDGDIFGKYDVVSTVKQNNNKIIVVQEYSLYDYIIHMDIIDEVNEQIRRDYINIEREQILSHLYIFAISIILSVVCIIVIISIISNNINDIVNANKDED